MTRYAYICIGAVGHLYPSLGVVRELLARGHIVTYVVPPWSEALAAKSGATVTCYQSSLLAAAPRKVNGFAVGDIPLHAMHEINTATEEIVDIIRRLRPDCLLVDGYTLTGFLAAEALQLPMIRMESSYLPGPYHLYHDAATGRLKSSLTSAQSLRKFEEGTADLIGRLAVPPKSFLELVETSGVRNVVFVGSEFHPCADQYDQRTVFVGPTHGGRQGLCLTEKMFSPKWRSPRRTRVFISFGSVFTHQPGLLDLLADALQSEEYDCACVVGNAYPEQWMADFPSNFHVGCWADQLAMLPEVDLFVTHGGMGSVMESLAHATPLLVIPQFPEQMATALRCEELGVGRFLDRETVSISLLRQTIRDMLRSRTLVQRCAQFQERLHIDGGHLRAADIIEDCRC